MKLTANPHLFDDFLKQQTSLIKKRVRLSMWVFLSLFIFGGGIGSWLIFGKIKHQLLFTWLFAICACIVVYISVKRASSPRRAKISAALLIFMLLFGVMSLQIKENSPPFQAVSVYLIMLFAAVFTFPWMPHEIIGVSLLHLGAYTFYFLSIPEYVYKHRLLYPEHIDYYQGMILLTVASCICFIVGRYERKREIENFSLLKKIEHNNRQMERELNLATRVHTTLIPNSFTSELADIAVMYLPMHFIGGDYAKFQFYNDRRLIFIICDVTGHGVPAALLVNRLHTEFERLANAGKEPGVLLKELDTFIIKDFEDTHMFLSAFCGLVDFTRRKLLYSNHGHPAQYVYRAKSEVLHRLQSQASLLGLPLEEEICQEELEITKGDKVFLFTDGLIETKDRLGNEFGKERLEHFIRSNHTVPVEEFNQRLVDNLKEFKYGDFADDVFMLSIEVKG